MEDFNQFIKNNNGDDYQKEMQNPAYQNLFNMVSDLASKFDGKNQNELMTAIYKEAKKGKENGTLKNSDIDYFVSMLSPFVDDKKKKILKKIAEELKKI